MGGKFPLPLLLLLGSEMERSLTKLEMNTVLQLTQLRRSSSLEAEKDKRDDGGEGRSAGEALISSSLININPENYEPLPRRNKRFGSLVDIYKKTRPL